MTATDPTLVLPAVDQAPFFRVEEVKLAFGGLRVLQGVNLEVKQGEIVGLIGPNGAGKTTLFDVISGFRPTATGKVLFKGVDLMQRKPYERAWLGLGRTFQTARLYQNVTVYDCVRTAFHRRFARNPLGTTIGGLLGTTKSKNREREIVERTDAVIDRLGLNDYAKKNASDLSYGTLRLTELATILALEPELILLDEPSSGIAQKETEALGPLLLELREELNATFLLIEHDMPLIMGISDTIFALASGEVLTSGPPEDVQNNPEVVESYLGGALEVA